MKFKLSESETVKPTELTEASLSAILAQEYRHLLGVETHALEDENWKMLDEVGRLQSKIAKKLAKIKTPVSFDESAIVNQIVKRMKAVNKKNGYVHMVDDRGIEVSIDIDSLDGDYVYGIDQHDNEVEIDLRSGDYVMLEACDKDDEEEVEEGGGIANFGKKKAKPFKKEADGSTNDAPVVTQGASTKFKLKTGSKDNLDEVQANKDVSAKKLAAKMAKMKKKAHCTGNKTPELIPGKKIKFKCSTVDKAKSRAASKAGKKRAQSAAGKQAAKAAAKTRAFRAK